MLRHPEIPELPPGYSVYGYDDDGGWFVYARGDYCDDVEPLPTRTAAVAEAWRLFYEYDASAEWNAFLKALGAP